MDYIFKELVSKNEFEIAQIIAIEQEAFGSGGMNHWFLMPFLRHGQVFVLENSGHIAAVAEFMRDFHNETTAYLFGLAVHQDHRGQGLGFQLLSTAHSSLRKQGFTKVCLTVDPNNTEALHLYCTKCNYVQMEFLPNEYGVGEDRLYLTLELTCP